MNSNHLAEATLRLEEVSKAFGGFEAVHDVTMEIFSGQIHALLGANGSGKSTLVKMMSGALEPSGGAMYWGGQDRVAFKNPADANRFGVRVVHQEAPLIDKFSVLESVATFRGYGTRGLGPIGWKLLRKEVAELLASMDVAVSIDEPCGKLGPSDRAGVALAIAAAQSTTKMNEGDGVGGLKLLILDEVTAAIPERDATQHLHRVRKLADSNIAVVMVTHRLGELDFADAVTVMRNGEVVHREPERTEKGLAVYLDFMTDSSAVDPSDQLTDDDDATRASSRRANYKVRLRSHPVTSLWETLPHTASSDQERTPANLERLSLENLSGTWLHDVTLHVNVGEVVGFAGPEEAALRELTHMLSGATRRTRGTIVVGGRKLSRSASPRDFIRAGMVTLPADRLHEGGIAKLTVDENAVLPQLGTYWHRRVRRVAVVDQILKSFEVSPKEPKKPFGELSGGNQQKVLLGKWLTLRPKVLVLDDPTHGVDPGAREMVFGAISDASNLGVSVLFFTTEPELLLRQCNRILVIRDGKVAANLMTADLGIESLMEWSYT